MSYEFLQRIKPAFDSLSVLHTWCLAHSELMFPVAVGVLEFCAGVVYAMHHKWHLGIAWICYGFAALALAIAATK